MKITEGPIEGHLFMRLFLLMCFIYVQICFMKVPRGRKFSFCVFVLFFFFMLFRGIPNPLAKDILKNFKSEEDFYRDYSYSDDFLYDIK